MTSAEEWDTKIHESESKYAAYTALQLYTRKFNIFGFEFMLYFISATRRERLTLC
jgi:hypothetical protein